MTKIVKKNIKGKYKLSSEVKFCKRCVVSNQRPRIVFDDEGVCSACRFAEHKKNVINWSKREAELVKLCNKHRSKDGSYDVIVPGSGGKDSNYVAHMLKEKYNMHPLVVTWAPHIYTDIGKKNLTAFIDSGFDNILITPNGAVHKKLTKAAFIEMGDPFQPFIFGQYSAPFRVAIQYEVPFVIYGEDGEVEYGGSMEHADRASLSYKDFIANRFSSVFPESFEKYGITKEELSKYGLSQKELKKIQDLLTKIPLISLEHINKDITNYLKSQEAYDTKKMNLTKIIKEIDLHNASSSIGTLETLNTIAMLGDVDTLCDNKSIYRPQIANDLYPDSHEFNKKNTCAVPPE